MSPVGQGVVGVAECGRQGHKSHCWLHLCSLSTPSPGRSRVARTLKQPGKEVHRVRAQGLKLPSASTMSGPLGSRSSSLGQVFARNVRPCRHLPVSQLYAYTYNLWSIDIHVIEKIYTGKDLPSAYSLRELAL